MRQLLLELAITSNGAVVNYAGRTSGGAEKPAPMLGHFDAPQLFYAAEWDRAETDDDRAIVVQRARDELYEITHRSAPAPSITDSSAELAVEIVQYGVGLSAHEVTLTAKCTVSFVRDARERAGREPEFGRYPRRWKQMTEDEQAAALREMVEDGMSGRAIAKAFTGVSYSTIARRLGHKA